MVESVPKITNETNRTQVYLMSLLFEASKKKQRSLPTNSTQTLQLCHSKPPRLPLVSRVSVPQVPPAARKKTKGIDGKTPKGTAISGGRLTHGNPFLSEGPENEIDKKKCFIRFIWLNYVNQNMFCQTMSSLLLKRNINQEVSHVSLAIRGHQSGEIPRIPPQPTPT